jgi:hypothetical protein
MAWELVEWEMRGRVGSVLKCFEMFFECFLSVSGVFREVLKCLECVEVCGSVLNVDLSVGVYCNVW